MIDEFYRDNNSAQIQQLWLLERSLLPDCQLHEHCDPRHLLHCHGGRHEHCDRDCGAQILPEEASPRPNQSSSQVHDQEERAQ